MAETMLKTGDLVEFLDQGSVPIIWVGKIALILSRNTFNSDCCFGLISGRGEIGGPVVVVLYDSEVKIISRRDNFQVVMSEDI